jgi:hypothetical protein
MHMKKLIMLSALPFLVALSSCQTTAPSPGIDRFAEADANYDDKLSSNEACDYFVTHLFTSRDFNHDGRLTWEEWHVAGVNDNKSRFNAADTNKDGGLSLSEARAHGRQHGIFAKAFHKADTNHDGSVTRAEARAYSASTEGPPR